MRRFRNELTPAPRWRLAAALLLSTLLHVGAALSVGRSLELPRLDVELTLPMDVELGTSESLELAPAPAEPPADETPDTARPGGGALDGGLPDAGLDAALADAGVPDAGGARVPDAAAVSRNRAARDGGRDAPHASEGDGGARMPPGAQIAVRVDMARIRESPLSEDVRRLLRAIPDWQALLEGSGIDPVTQLERLLIATPNLDRDKLVLAGRYVGGEQVVRDAVARLAAARGVEARWRREGNVRVAPWASADRTERVIALVGPAHFVIARPSDLPRILAIASARADRGRGPESRRAHPADALLSMEEGEGISVEVEGARRFVRRGERLAPERLRVAAIAARDQRIALHGLLAYAKEEEARTASAYLADLKDAYARNTLVMLLGLSAALDEARVAQRGEEVEVSLGLNAAQARLVLGYLRELLRPPRPPP